MGGVWCSLTKLACTVGRTHLNAAIQASMSLMGGCIYARTNPYEQILLGTNMTVKFLKMTSFKAMSGLWVATLTETTTFLGVKVRTNNIIASDVVLTSSCVIPTVDETTGVVSDYPINRNDVFFAIRTQYKVFLVENSDECK